MKRLALCLPLLLACSDSPTEPTDLPVTFSQVPAFVVRLPQSTQLDWVRSQFPLHYCAEHTVQPDYDDSVTDFYCEMPDYRDGR